MRPAPTGTIEALEDLCDAVGVATVLHPALRRAVRAAEREFCDAAAGYLQGRAGDTFLLPLADGGQAALVFSRRLSSGGVGILRVDTAALDQVRRSLPAGLPSEGGHGSGPARPR